MRVVLPSLQYYALDLDFQDISTTLTLHKNSVNNLDDYISLPSNNLAPSTPDSVSTKSDNTDGYKERLLKIYKKHNPKKIPLIDGWLERNAHDPHSLYEKICERYKITPEPRIDIIDDL